MAQTTESDALAALRASEEKYRGLVESLNEWVWEVDEHVVYTYVGPQIRDLLGYEPEEVLGHTPFEFMTPAEAARVRAAFAPLAERRASFTSLENTMVGRDGRQVTLVTSARPIFEEGGRFAGYRGIDRDVTAEREAQARLRASEEKYRAIFNGVGDAISLWDPATGQIVEANRRTEELYGYSAAELPGLRMGAISSGEPPYTEAGALRYMRLAMAGEPQRFEWHARHRSGRVFWIEVSLQRVDLAGRPFVLVVKRDISERKAAQDAVLAEQQRLAAVLQALPIAVFITDRQGRMTDANRLLRDIWGAAATPPSDMAEFARYRGWWADTGQPVAPDQWPLSRALLQGEVVLGKAIEVERLDGSRRLVLNSAAPFRDSRGGVAGAVSVMQDVTEQRQLEARAQRQAATLQAVLTQVPVGIVLLDTELRTLMVNPAAAAMAGRPPAELIGATLADLVGRPFGMAEGQRVISLNQEVLATGRPMSGREELLQPTGTGEPLYVDWAISRVDDPAGRPLGTITTLQDVTSRVLDKRALAESEAWLRTLVDDVFNASAIAMLIIDADLRLVWTNQAAQEYLNLPIPEAFGQDKRRLIEQYVAPLMEDPTGFTERVMATYEDGSYLERFECHVLPREGRPERWLEHTSQPIRSGLYAGGRIEQYADITERKRVEEALRQSEERFRAVVNASPLAVVAVDSEERVTLWNPAAERLLGWSADEVIGGELPYRTPEEEQAFRGLFDRVRAGEMLSGAETTVVRRDGSTLEMSISTALLHDDQGRVVGIMGLGEDITDRRRAAQALRESEERFRAVVQAAPIAIVSFDRDGRVQLWNPAAQRIFGWSEEDVLGRELPFRRESQARLFGEWRERALAGQPVQSVEIPSYRKDGTPIEISISASLLRDSVGQITGIMGMAEDITERRRAETALRRREEQLRALVQASPVAIVSLDRDGRITSWNPAAERIFGWREQEVRGQELPYANERQAEIWRELERRVLSGDSLTNIEMRSYRRDGTPLEVSVSAGPMRDAEGRIFGIMGVTADITERKRGEQALRREQAFLSAAIEILPFPLGFTAPDHRLLRANRAAYAFFAPREPARWQDLNLLTGDLRVPMPPEQFPTNRALAGQVQQSVEAVLALADGRQVPVLFHAAPVYVEGEQVAAVWAIQDITELKQADRAKDQFLAVLSHELLTPLTSILGWVQAARRAPAETGQVLEVIERNAWRQKGILDDLLDVSRIIHGRLDMRPESLDLWQLAAQAAEEMQPLARAGQLELTTSPPDGPLPVSADPRRVRQAIDNLLSNAIKFTPAGGHVELRGRRRGESWAVIEVADTGRGLPPDQLSELFTPFRQIERVEGTTGLGLGLALTKGIVELHGGRVRAASPGVGQGATFTIELPLAGSH